MFGKQRSCLPCSLFHGSSKIVVRWLSQAACWLSEQGGPLVRSAFRNCDLKTVCSIQTIAILQGLLLVQLVCLVVHATNFAPSSLHTILHCDLLKHTETMDGEALEQAIMDFVLAMKKVLTMMKLCCCHHRCSKESGHQNMRVPFLLSSIQWSKGTSVQSL
jgi:hypothetical protein